LVGYRFLAPHHQGYREINKEVISPEKAFFITLILLIKHQNRTYCIDECSISFRVDVSRWNRCCTGLQTSCSLVSGIVKSGNVIATNNLADKYEYGLGVEQDLDIAFELYAIAAEGNVVAAHLSLGRMYLQGRGIEKIRFSSKTFERSVECRY
jgi:TPR repeat protein